MASKEQLKRQKKTYSVGAILTVPAYHPYWFVFSARSLINENLSNHQRPRSGALLCWELWCYILQVLTVLFSDDDQVRKLVTSKKWHTGVTACSKLKFVVAFRDARCSQCQTMSFLKYQYQFSEQNSSCMNDRLFHVDNVSVAVKKLFGSHQVKQNKKKRVLVCLLFGQAKFVWQEETCMFEEGNTCCLAFSHHVIYHTCFSYYRNVFL